MTAMGSSKGAVAYPVAPGVQGGLGHHAAQVVDACASAWQQTTAFGPAPRVPQPPGVRVVTPALHGAGWRERWTWRRYLQGSAQLETDRAFGRWLSTQAGREFDGCYVFTQIALELLQELRKRGTPHVLDNPNGHIRDFRQAVQQEADAWLPTRYPGHPAAAMVDRVEEEYATALRIRVGSTWAATSMASRGVDPSRISVVPHSVDLARFSPGAPRSRADGALRVVFVGSLSLGKGFPYLLKAVHAVGAHRVSVQIVGATGDPWCRRLFHSLRQGLSVTVAPGDPLPAYRDADVLVLPTLHDGFGFVVAEAMACGLPVITTDRCGAAELLRQDDSGWVVPAGSVEALASALEHALQRAGELREMGVVARRSIEIAAGVRARNSLIQLVRDYASGVPAADPSPVLMAAR